MTNNQIALSELLKHSDKEYSVFERVFVDHELMEVSQEMRTLEQIEAHVERMTSAGWSYECGEIDRTNNRIDLVFYI